LGVCVHPLVARQPHLEFIVVEAIIVITAVLVVILVPIKVAPATAPGHLALGVVHLTAVVAELVAQLLGLAHHFFHAALSAFHNVVVIHAGEQLLEQVAELLLFLLRQASECGLGEVVAQFATGTEELAAVIGQVNQLHAFVVRGWAAANQLGILELADQGGDGTRANVECFGNFSVTDAIAGREETQQAFLTPALVLGVPAEVTGLECCAGEYRLPQQLAEESEKFL
jgi:hypothetical protein